MMRAPNALHQWTSIDRYISSALLRVECDHNRADLAFATNDDKLASEPSPRRRGEGAAKRRMRGAILPQSPLTRRCALPSPRKRGEGSDHT